MFYAENSSIRQEVDSNGFIRTLMSKHSHQYRIHLTLIMQEYLNINDNLLNDRYDLSDTLEIFQNNPEIADRILSEMQEFVKNPNAVTSKNDWHSDFIEISNVLSIYYQNYCNSTNKFLQAITAQQLIKKIEEYKNYIESVQRRQADVENSRIQEKIQKQITSLRGRSDIDREVISKLTMTNPVLSWKINPKYVKGPFRTGIISTQTGMCEYETTAKIPMFDELSRSYPDLMKAACNNPEQQPAAHIVQAAAVSWQQKLLLDNARSLGVSDNILASLMNTPVQLPWDLNEDNESAPGYRCEYARWGSERYVTIPLRNLLIEKYPDLMQAAEANKQPRPAVIRTARAQENPNPVLFRPVAPSTPVTLPIAPTTRQIAKYNEIIDLIGKNIDIIDEIDLRDKPMLICPLTQCLMRDPVILGTTGLTFEREAIITALQTRPNINPLDNLRLTNTQLAPNFAVRGVIIEFLNGVNFKTRLIEQRNSKQQSGSTRKNKF